MVIIFNSPGFNFNIGDIRYCENCFDVRRSEVKDLIVLRFLMVVSSETSPFIRGSGNFM